MGTLWNKIWFDLWHNKTRTMLAVLSIAAGVFAMGAIFGMSDLLSTNMNQSHRSVEPPHIEIALAQTVDQDTLLNLAEVPGVEGVEPYFNISIQYKLHPQDPWRQGVIQIRNDYNHQKYELVELKAGDWPKSKNEIGIEQMASGFLNTNIGGNIIFKIGETERSLPVTSRIRHPFVPPPQFMDLAFFFMGKEGLERFGIPAGTFNNVFVRVTPYSPEHAREVATAIKDKLAKQNIRVLAWQYQDPAKHWGSSTMDSFLFVQKFLALISVGMSLVLVFNTLTNVITQQTNQIGILKAIGASSGKIVSVYMLTAFIYGLLALIISIPLGALVAFAVTKIFLGLFNIEVTRFMISRQAVTYQVASAVIAPLLAGIAPTLKGANITVRQAIASYGLGGDFHSNWLDRLVEGIGQRWLSSQYATALGNMFRHKGRLFLTQLVLIAAGSAFLIVMSLNSSIALTLDNIFARDKFDTLLQFQDNLRMERVETLAKLVPGVVDTEMQMYFSINLIVTNQFVNKANIGASLMGISPSSDYIQPLIVAGRWLTPGDGQVVVINRKTADDNHIQVGDMVTLDLGVLGKRDWQVVGIYDPIFVGTFSSNTYYAPWDALSNVTKKYNQAMLLYVRTEKHDRQSVTDVTTRLKDYFDVRNMKVAISQTTFASRDTAEWQFNLVVYMMLALSVIVALVGGITLMGALSIGVIERTKEIGVLRALGARSSTILGIFIMEGLLQGIVSWLVAVPISYFASPFIATALGKAMFGATLDYQFNLPAMGIWFALIFVISMLASILPARSATLISVRDSLAYA